MHKLLLYSLLLSFAPLVHADLDLSKPLDLKFTAVDGRQVDLSKMRGKVVVVDFWATWCPPCRRIAPDLAALYQKYHNQGLEVVGVSVDSDKNELLDVIKKEGLVWPQYFDGKGPDNEVADRFGVEEFPTMWLLDKKGMIVDANFRDLWIVGFGIPDSSSETTRAKIDAEVEKYLKAP